MDSESSHSSSRIVIGSMPQRMPATRAGTGGKSVTGMSKIKMRDLLFFLRVFVIEIIVGGFQKDDLYDFEVRWSVITSTAMDSPRRDLQIRSSHRFGIERCKEG